MRTPLPWIVFFHLYKLLAEIFELYDYVVLPVESVVFFDHGKFEPKDIETPTFGDWRKTIRKLLPPLILLMIVSLSLSACTASTARPQPSATYPITPGSTEELVVTLEDNGKTYNLRWGNVFCSSWVWMITGRLT